MLKDITIGQFYPAESLVHRLDPRLKIILVIWQMVLVFFIRTYEGYAAYLAFVLLATFVSRVPLRFVLRSLKPLVFIIIFTFVLNLFFNNAGNTIWQWWVLRITDEGLQTAIRLAIRLALLVMGASLLTLTTSPISLTDGLERLFSPLGRIGFPAHELAMMMTIALRFIPTLMDETNRIMQAQKARGADFDTGGLVKRAKSLIPLIVPLFLSAFRRADELAMAMESRCYRGGKGRTRMNALRFALRDAAVFAFTAAFGASLLAWGL